MTDWDARVPLPAVGEAGPFALDAGLALERLSPREPDLFRVVGDDGPRVLRLCRGELRYAPALPAEALMLRFDARVEVPAGTGGLSLYAGLPVDTALEHVSADGAQITRVALRASPALKRRLALGKVDDATLARAVDVSLCATPSEVPPGLAVLPLRFLGATDTARTVDRVMLPAGGLCLWAGGPLLFTSAVEIDLREGEAVGVRVLPEVPRADVTLRFGPTSDTGEFSLRSIMRALTQFVRGVE